MDLNEIIDAAPQNQLIQNTMMKMDLKLSRYKNPVCSVSGGSDSDIMIDIIERVRGNRPVTYVFFDTGIEYDATKRHLDFIEKKYDIKIARRVAAVPVPKGCREHGQPFMTKMVSEYIGRLQKHGFKWEDESFDVLVNRYPRCQSALRWFCNAFGDDSSFNISNIPYLREFLIEHPPKFAISYKCCEGAKKNPGHLFDADVNCHMKILGLRRAEGGVRATTFTSCFTAPEDGDVAQYRPIWFWSDDDKTEYCKHYDVTHSDCYCVWGMTRTGCAGCPFGSKFEKELELIHEHEPRLELAVNNIFRESYEYTRNYRAYRDKLKARNKTEVVGQIGWEDANG